MDFDANQLLASLLVSSIGLVLFMYGRRQKRVPHILTGVLLMAFPYFVSNVWLMFVIAAAVLGLFWGALRLGW